jgi:hypothetical protein
MSYKMVELVLNNGPSNSTERLLLVAIAENANNDGYGWPGLEKLALRSCRTRRHVIRLIQNLETGGWLTSFQRAEGFGRKQTAYQLNLAQLKAPSLGGPRPLSRISSDIFVQSDVTSTPISGDISTLHILKNHEPSLEPSAGALAPELKFGFGGDHAQGLVSKPATATGSRPGNPSDEEVERIRLAYPRKVASVQTRKAIRTEIAALMLGRVTAANGEAVPKMPKEQAVLFLESATERFAKSPAGMAGKHTPYPSTFFSGQRYTEDPSEWGEKKPAEAGTITVMPPPISTADRARMQQGRLC